LKAFIKQPVTNMRISRLYLDIPLSEQQTITLDGERLNYIANVLRLKANTQLSIFNGRGGEHLALITAINKRSATIEVQAFSDKDTESPLSITLVQGISRGERMDFTLQKATELGVNRIIPVFSQRCTVNLKGERLTKRLQHWQGVVNSACEQSGRNIIPQVEAAQELEAYLELENGQCRIFLDPEATQTLNSISPAPASATILIGPEGGFDSQERQKIYTKNYQGIQLGPRVLRTETAAIATISAMQILWGDFQTN